MHPRLVPHTPPDGIRTAHPYLQCPNTARNSRQVPCEHSQRGPVLLWGHLRRGWTAPNPPLAPKWAPPTLAAPRSCLNKNRITSIPRSLQLGMVGRDPLNTAAAPGAATGPSVQELDHPQAVRCEGTAGPHCVTPTPSHNSNPCPAQLLPPTKSTCWGPAGCV